MIDKVHILILISHPFELWNPPPWFAERLQAEFPQVHVVHRDNYADTERYLADADILVAWSLQPEQFRAATRLRWIHSPAAAVHGVLLPEVIASNIVVTNGAPVNGPVVAEHAIALLLALSKRLDSALRAQIRHTWAQQQLWEGFPRPREISGATLTLVGLGQIGGALARLAAGLGMKVAGVREHPARGLDWLPAGASPDGHSTYGPEQLDSPLALADYVVLAAPLTASTRFLIDRRRLSLMRPHACLINVGRGDLVEEAALIEALRARKIGGAALDVFASEPLASDSPLWDLENVILTPHSAAMFEHVWHRQYKLFSENLRRWLAAKPLLTEVNKLKGY